MLEPTSHETDTVYLFVYGTLCKGAKASKNHYLESDTHYIGEAFLQAKLFMVDYYPGVIDSADGNDRVKGELYQIIVSSGSENTVHPVLKKLDDYEGCGPDYSEPWQYRREKRTVTLNTGALFTAWVYIYNHSTEHLIEIRDGDFIKHQSSLGTQR